MIAPSEVMGPFVQQPTAGVGAAMGLFGRDKVEHNKSIAVDVDDRVPVPSFYRSKHECR